MVVDEMVVVVEEVVEVVDVVGETGMMAAEVESY